MRGILLQGPRKSLHGVPGHRSTRGVLFEEKERLQEHNLQTTISGGGRRIKSI